MKQFSHYKMSSEYDGSKLVSGYFYADDAQAAVEDGTLVVVGDVVDHSVFTGMYDFDNRKVTLPEATTDRVAVVDYVGVSEGMIGGNLYREGIKTAGLTCPAGRPTRVRVLEVGDTFFTASGNFDTTPSKGKFAIPTANSGVWTVVNEASDTETCIKIEGSKPLTQGTVDADTLYFCTVVNAI